MGEHEQNKEEIHMSEIYIQPTMDFGGTGPLSDHILAAMEHLRLAEESHSEAVRTMQGEEMEQWLYRKVQWALEELKRAENDQNHWQRQRDQRDRFPAFATMDAINPPWGY